MAALAGVTALAIALAGCGGGGDASAETPLTKAQFVKQGTKICAEEGERIGEEMATYGETHNLNVPTGSPKAEQLTEEVLLRGFRGEVEALEELSPPRGDEAQVEAMLAKFQTGLEEGEEDPAILFTKSEFPKGTKAAEQYGLKGCGTLFLSSS
jgi:hypothetical protein